MKAYSHSTLRTDHRGNPLPAEYHAPKLVVEYAPEPESTAAVGEPREHRIEDGCVVISTGTKEYRAPLAKMDRTVLADDFDVVTWKGRRNNRGGTIRVTKIKVRCDKCGHQSRVLWSEWVQYARGCPKCWHAADRKLMCSPTDLTTPTPVLRGRGGYERER
jgi:hypothetical protein